jgi:DNA-binding NarL/FixJ family response regulator
LAKRSDIASPRIQAWRGLIEQDWELMTDTCAHLALGWSEGDVGRRAAEHLRESVTRDVARAAMAAADTVDVTDLLQQVEMPTLVLHRREISWFPVDVATGLASRMPNAELTLLDGESTAPYLGDAQAAAKAIERFLDAEVDPLRVNGRSVTPRESSLEAEAELDKPRGAVQHGLTEREVQVLRLVAGGQTGKQIAAELVLSPRTVERHVENIYGKIGARNKADATAYALTRGIV